MSIDKIIAYENGELDGQDTLDLFAGLIESGQAWSLQGSYGRAARNLIDNGWISPEGEILKEFPE